MAKSGQARVFTPEQFSDLLLVLKQHRHPEKNTALVQLSFKLGLRAQEIASLQIVEIAKLEPTSRSPRGFTLRQTLRLSAAYAKDEEVLRRAGTIYEPQTIRFGRNEFDQVVYQIEALAKAGVVIDPADFYPAMKKYRGKSRDLPLQDPALRDALTDYLKIRIEQNAKVEPSAPLFATQKGGPYSPNTLQEHFALMYREWAGVKQATSQSGRRTLLTDVIQDQKVPVKTAQRIAGHISPSTTLRYEEPSEERVRDILARSNVKYSGRPGTSFTEDL